MIKLKENKQELDSCILSTFLKLSTVTLQLAAGSWRVVTCCLKFIGFINYTKLRNLLQAVKCTYSDTG